MIHEDHAGHGSPQIGQDTKTQIESHGHEANSGWKSHWPLLTGFVILAIMLTMEFGFGLVPAFPFNFIIFTIAYLLSGYNVLYLAWRKALRLDFFNEFFLMSIATIGAFAIGAFSEGVAVMVFYSIGEWFQDEAVNRAKRSIKALLDVRPEEVTVMEGDTERNVHPKEVAIGSIIQVRPGEKVALDGELVSDQASFNTSALTGESIPDTRRSGDRVYAGMISLNTVALVKVTAIFADSKLSRILEMVQDATSRKSRTQLFINRFAKIYTPIVFALAVLVCVLPIFLTDDYRFYDWFYRSLVFLVISCPCGLVVSIPLGYFGGIGLASRNGILFKGSNFLDVMTEIDTVVMDKTGTLTQGVFKVQRVQASGIGESELLRFAAAAESRSTHPIALAIAEYASGNSKTDISHIEEIPGHGILATVDGKQVAAGNAKLLKRLEIPYPKEIGSEANTIVLIAVDGIYSGNITIADEVRPDARQTIGELKQMGIRTVMLSGDKQSVVDAVAGELGVDKAFGDLLPEDKVSHIQKLKNEGRRIAFAGDGLNDAPVVALADAGIAMGGLGSDTTIETADIVIQNDRPSRIVTATRVGKLTKRVVWQNIALAMTVKIAVLALGAGGVANLWEAVIADVGVALVAILNAFRIQQMKLS